MPEIDSMITQFADALLEMNPERCRSLIHNLTIDKNGIEAFEKVGTPALEKIGLDWEQGQISLSQVYMAGRISEDLIGELLPLDEAPPKGRLKMAIGVIEDYHALGKRMVISLLRSSGYPITDYGHGVKWDDLASMAIRDNVDILFISCLMLSSAIRVKDLMDKIKNNGAKTVVVVGGAPFRLDPFLWQETGAHFMGKNSADALKIVKTLMMKEVEQWK